MIDPDRSHAWLNALGVDLVSAATPGRGVLDAPRPTRNVGRQRAQRRVGAHTNRPFNGSWTQHYAVGVPVADLVPLADDGRTGGRDAASSAPRWTWPRTLTRRAERVTVLSSQGLSV